MCFRDDKERSIDNLELQKLLHYCKEKNIETSITTTVINKWIKPKDREQIFYQKIEEFKHSKLVITDRLHAMLFSAISGTPCIALNNLSGKVQGGYEWIKHLKYIRFADSPGQIYRYLDEMICLGGGEYQNTVILKEFKRLAGWIAREKSLEN